MLSRAIDYYALSSFVGALSELLITSFTSDWLYPTHQSVELEMMARQAGISATRHEIDLPYGHDAFLLDAEIQGAMAREFFMRG